MEALDGVIVFKGGAGVNDGVFGFLGDIVAGIFCDFFDLDFGGDSAVEFDSLICCKIESELDSSSTFSSFKSFKSKFWSGSILSSSSSYSSRSSSIPSSFSFSSFKWSDGSESDSVSD